MKTRLAFTILLFVALLGLGAPAALAAPRGVCVSQKDGNWSDSTTWTCGRSPNSSDDVIILHNITLNTNGQAYFLYVERFLACGGCMDSLNVGAGGVMVKGTFQSPATLNITGSLTNNGYFNTNLVDGTIVMNGAAAQNINSNIPLTFYNLTIDNSAGVNLTTNATVNGTLTLNYDLRVSDGYALTMGRYATTQGDADVVGKTRRAHTFTSNTPYTFGSPYTTIRFTGGTLPSEINVQLFKSAPGGLANAVQRYYSITPTGGSGYTFDLQLHYRDSELGSVNEGNLQMWQQVDGRWTLRSATSRDTSNNWVQKTGLTSFSLWALSDSGAPTAVTLSAFEARADAPSALPFIGLGALAVVMLGVVLWRRTMSQ